MKNKKFDPFKNLKLDPYEQEINDAIETGKVKSVENMEEAKKEAMEAALYTERLAKKDKRVSIRVNGGDLKAIRVKAAENMLPYQTLISTLLHRFASGKIRIEL